MFDNDCQHCREHMVAYINGELGRRRTRWMAEHLRECETCYAAYVRERDAGHTITHELTLLGRAEKPQLDALWGNIEAQLQSTPARSSRLVPWERGLVGVALAILVALPWAMLADDWVANAAVPVGVTPALEPEGTSIGTQASDDTPLKSTAVALNLPTEDAQPATPTSTPAVAPIPDELP